MVDGESTLYGLTIGDMVAGKYEVLRLLGEGGMGAVYEVRHAHTRRHFALKWMTPQLARSRNASARFLREAQSACALDHPNVVQVFDVDRHEGGMYSVMELLDGQTLGERVAAGPLPAESAARLVLPLLHGLHAAHARGVIHRDLKPDNLFLMRVGEGGAVRPKILDFGLSTPALLPRGERRRLTRTGAMMGTPAYMSPEQARDAGRVDERGDVYSMGAVLYEALTGRLPFEAESVIELLLQICDEEPPPLRLHAPSISASVESVVLRCLAKDPDARPPSAEALAFELCDALRLSRSLFAPGEASGSLPGELDPTEEMVALPVEVDTTPDHGSEEPTAVHAARVERGLRTGRRAGLVGAVLAVGLVAVLVGWVAASGTGDTEPAPPVDAAAPRDDAPPEAPRRPPASGSARVSADITRVEPSEPPELGGEEQRSPLETGIDPPPASPRPRSEALRESAGQVRAVPVAPTSRAVRRPQASASESAERAPTRLEVGDVDPDDF
ncbi:MAG: serine/threonine-protein kinase [Sandaracinaceae bacterium]